MARGWNPWDESICHMAAEQGEWELVKWLREHGCPWDVSTYRAAANQENLEVVEWLKENGCPWDDEEPEITMRNNQRD